jgi:pimeloyl-ACP methyl ester carboxylesterase
MKAKSILTAGLVLGGALSAMTIYNKVTETMAGELDTALNGEERRYPWKDGDMFYQVKGAHDAKPLLLVHSFGPGASSYEWRKNVDSLAEQFRVYTIDLLGFGLSDRPAIDYTAETYIDLISDFIKEVIGKPTVVVAHGLACAYVISDAFRHPQLFERLILLAPPPTILQESMPGPLSAVARSVLCMPVIGQFIYNQLTSRRAIRGFYDVQGYHNPGLITDELVEYVYTNAHQPNARYAQASLLTDYLTMDVREPFARLQMPVVLVFGREGVLTPSEASEAFKRVNPRVEVRILDKSSGHAQDEQATAFNNLVKEFAGTRV